MKLNKKQIELLMKLNKQDGSKSITELGKGIYSTYRTVHVNMDKFFDMGIVEYETKKNKVVPRLTPYGKSLLRTLL
ncbi:MAG: hypothetical protein ACOCP4_05505 [Candidatus Woesearchaeota archaeon]